MEIQSSLRGRRYAIERAADEILKTCPKKAMSERRELATKWHRELPKERRQEINTAFRERRLAGIIRCSFADWLIDTFGSEI